MDGVFVMNFFNFFSVVCALIAIASCSNNVKYKVSIGDEKGNKIKLSEEKVKDKEYSQEKYEDQIDKDDKKEIQKEGLKKTEVKLETEEIQDVWKQFERQIRLIKKTSDDWKIFHNQLKEFIRDLENYCNKTSLCSSLYFYKERYDVYTNQVSDLNLEDIFTFWYNFDNYSNALKTKSIHHFEQEQKFFLLDIEYCLKSFLENKIENKQEKDKVGEIQDLYGPDDQILKLFDEAYSILNKISEFSKKEPIELYKKILQKIKKQVDMLFGFYSKKGGEFFAKLENDLNSVKINEKLKYMHPSVKNNFEKFIEEIENLKYECNEQFTWIYSICIRNTWNGEKTQEENDLINKIVNYLKYFDKNFSECYVIDCYNTILNEINRKNGFN